LRGGDVEAAARRLAQAAVLAIDLRRHHGAHPRVGAVDVVPFVPIDATGAAARPGDDLGRAIAARQRFATWAATTLGLPCFVYGPERTLPEVRRHAFDGLQPDTGPPVPHPSAGACAVGARPALVAYNVWLKGSDIAAARKIADAIRGPAVRTLGLGIGGHAQVSCNLVDPFTVGPDAVLAAVTTAARGLGVEVARPELVGLAPLAVVAALDPEARARCGVDLDHTFEARLRRT
jgi:glutamate formiminotransferase